MKIVPVEMKCSVDMSKQTVYCYVSSNNLVKALKLSPQEPK